MAPTPSGSKQRARRAVKAMEVMGFTSDVVVPLLKRLLRTFDNLWEHIEAENYRVLVDALLDAQSGELSPDDDGGSSSSKKSKSVYPAPQTRVTRQQVKREEEHASPAPKRKVDATQELHQKTSRGDQSPQTPVTPRAAEAGSSPQPSSFIKKARCAGAGADASSSQLTPMKRAAQEMEGLVPPLLAYGSEKRPLCLSFKEPKIEPGIGGSPAATYGHGDEQFSDCYPLIESPLATLPPVNTTATAREDQSRVAGLSTRDTPGLSMRDTPSLSMRDTPVSQANTFVPSEEARVQKDNGKALANACKRGATDDLARVHEPASHVVDVAQSASGEVKLSFSFSSDIPNFHMPNIEDALKAVEDRCLRSYKIIQPDFSLMNVMKEMCQCILELGAEPPADKRENTRNGNPAIMDSLRRYGLNASLASLSNGLPNVFGPRMSGLSTILGCHPNPNGTIEKTGISNGLGGASITSNSLVVVPDRHLDHPDAPAHDVTDISRGEERVRIPLVNEHSNEMLSRSFFYIPQNIVHQNAYVHPSLARIGDEDCCADCSGDCLAEGIVPCACARETGGEFAYTRDGLVKKKFLDTCISMNHNPEKNLLFFCKVCPIERSKSSDLSDVPDPCKGHTIRKFIKECWSKCGCNKQCGNRVVQRGITCNLEVFYTEERKGWGVRTLDELPRGAFVCEYVGEILTNTELYERTLQTTGNARHTYPVLLDADWGSEGVLKDEEALCLDATFYGNVARFVNHRCEDANLIEIPVEVETPDRHYYHLAFFTTRKVEALEELTWDYGIDFDDNAHPIKAFQCHCGSKYCRDMKRQKSRSRKQQRNG